MSAGRFIITPAVLAAYAFVGHNWRYFLKLGLLPFAFQAGAVLGVRSFLPEDATAFAAFIWTLPAQIASAWYMFVCARFALLGERAYELPRDADFLRARRRLMTAAVIVILLFKMFLVATSEWISWAMDSGRYGNDSLTSLAALFIIGAVVWALRFAVAHILVAVGFPLRRYLARVRGMLFSFQLIGLGLMASLPPIMLLAMFVSALAPAVEEGAQAMSEGMMSVFLLLVSVFSTFIPVLMNTAAAFALRGMLGATKVDA
jgi:hypothetical protein